MHKSTISVEYYISQRAEVETKLKMNFQVTSNSQARKLADSGNIRSELYNEVSDIIPRSCFTEFMETERKKHKRKRVESVPTSLECAESFKDCCDTELEP